MGSCLPFSFTCDQVVNVASQSLCLKWSYIRKLSENLETLKEAMEVLLARRDDVQERVVEEEFTRQRQRLAQVEQWLTSTSNIKKRYNTLLGASELELQKLCLCGFCSKNLNLISSYRYGKMVILMLEEVRNLTSQGQFGEVTKEVPRARVEELPTPPTIVGQETLLESVWKLMENVGIVGLYGMGGVGKTTLLRQMNNKFSTLSHDFSILIWVVVSKDAPIHKIQGDIAEKLGLVVERWDEKNERRRAIDIYNVLKGKKFVLFLDDMWEKKSLEDIGVPYPNNENGCKVAFTTRSHDVCDRMGVHDPFEVRCLETEKAWELFRNKVGDITLESHPDIPQISKKVAGKCRGLPLALNVIGETMSCRKTVQGWNHALDVLSSAARDFPSVEDDILPILKLSYDSLNGDNVKKCFLYCSLFCEDELIEKEELFEYWVCEGFINEKGDRERALNLCDEILETLVHACLLEACEDGNNRHAVVMHDVVREMTLWISSEFGKDKERCIVQAGIGLREIPKVKNWKNVTRMSLSRNEIGEIPKKSIDCPQLTTLLLTRNIELVTIPGEFIRSMPSLLVLDLSWNQSLKELPEEITRLVSLRYLNLAVSRIKRLPVGLQELKMLIHLDLGNTSELESVEGISKLSSLRTLKLQYSKVCLDMSLMKELELLENLEFVSADISSGLVGDQLLCNFRVWNCFQDILIVDRQKASVKVLVLSAWNHLRHISINDCEMREIKIEKKTLLNKSLTSPPFFSNLSSVTIKRCHGLKDLTWLLFAPNLNEIVLRNLNKLEDIINMEKAASLLDKESCNYITIPFQKLERVLLSRLPKLKNIYSKALPLQRLRELCILDDCDSLRKLPLDSKSLDKVEQFEISYKDEKWIERIEWDDEATQNRFLPSCKQIV